MRVEDLDGAVLADLACTSERVESLAKRRRRPPTDEIITAGSNFILRDHEIGRTYALQLIDHVDVHGERIVITPKEPGGRKELAMVAALQ